MRNLLVADPAEAHDVLLGLVLEHLHGVVDGDDADQAAAVIDHRGRDQVILVEGIGHVRFRLLDVEGAELVRHQAFQRHRAPRAEQHAEGNRADRPCRRIDDDDVVEILRQIVRGAQVIDHLAHGPERRRLDHLALHQAPGAVFGIGQRLGDRGAVGGLQRFEGLAPGRLVEVLEQVDHIVGFELPDRLGQLLRRQEGEDLVAHALLELDQQLVVDIGPDQLDKAPPVPGIDLFGQVGEVGDMELRDQRQNADPVGHVDRFHHRRDKLRVERVFVLALVRLGLDG